MKRLVAPLVLVSVAVQSAGPRLRWSIANAVLPRRSTLIATRSPSQRTSSVARARFSAAPAKVAVAVTRRLGPSRLNGIAALRRGARLPARLTAIPPIGLGEIHAFEIFGGVMVLFFLISFPLTRLAVVLEKRLARAGYG